MGKRKSKSLRQQVIAKRTVDGLTVDEITDTLPVCRRTVYQIIDEYRTGKLDCDDFLEQYRSEMIHQLAELQAKATARALEKIGEEKYATHAAQVARTASDMLGKAAGEADLKIAHEVHDARSRVEAKILEHVEGTLIEGQEQDDALN